MRLAGAVSEVQAELKLATKGLIKTLTLNVNRYEQT